MGAGSPLTTANLVGDALLRKTGDHSLARGGNCGALPYWASLLSGFDLMQTTMATVSSCVQHSQLT